MSREAEGTKVTLTVPLIAVTHPLRRESDPIVKFAPQSSVEEAHPSGVTVLLAEDSDINQELIPSCGDPDP